MEARKAGDTILVALLERQLQEIEIQKDALDQKKNTLKNKFRNEQKKLESELNADDQKQEQEEHDQDVKEQKEEVEAEEAEELQEEVEVPEKSEVKENREQKGSGSQDQTQESPEESEGGNGR